MGNLGRLKKKIKKNLVTVRAEEEKETALFVYLESYYLDLLKDNELEQVQALVQLAEKTKDSILCAAIHSINCIMVENLGFDSESLNVTKNLSFLLDNPQYAEGFVLAINSAPKEEDEIFEMSQKECIRQVTDYLLTLEQSYIERSKHKKFKSASPRS